MKRLCLLAFAASFVVGQADAQAPVRVCTPSYNSSGAMSCQDVSSSNPLPTTSSGAGSVGADYSANAATIPISGYVLLTTVPANSTRSRIEVQNQSAGTVQIVLDNGSGANQSSVLLTGVGASQQGGGWWSTSFTGRARIYGASGAQVYAAQY